jgi:uncharacterized protein YcbX
MNTVTLNSDGFVAYDRRVVTTDKGFGFVPNATLPVANFLTDVHIHGSLNLTNSNQINQKTMNQQAKVAVFKVTRNEDGGITSSNFIEEFWIQKKPGVSIDYTVAKLLKGDYPADEIVIREILAVTL